MLSRRALGALAVLLMLVAPVGRPAAAQDADWDIDQGHFFTQTGGGGGAGYAVTDEDGVRFWSRFRELGGVDALGYPVSRRFVLDGFVTQAMQRLVFQWRPEARQAYFLNTLDVLSDRGYDERLFVTRQVPRPASFSEAGKAWAEIVSARLSLLEDRPAIKTKYFSVRGDPRAFNGLPVSTATDMGNHYALRTQRAVLQEWKEDVPWARKGQVTVALGGSLAREAGLIPEAALRPESARPRAESVPTPSQESLFATRQVVSLYGFPGVPVLGALGEQGLQDTVTRAKEVAARVDAQNGPLITQPAFHMIFAIAYPSPVPGHLGRATVEEYIAAAGENGILVFLDLQIAGSPLQDELELALPYLRHPHVHLAIDPEFATPSPGRVIGSLDASQINAAQQQISEYLDKEGLEGRKILIVHQFEERMITRKQLLKDYPRIDLVIDADGVGGKAAKIGDYRDYADHPTREYLGFKVFLGHDAPPMSMGEVLALDPAPHVIIFQ